MPQITSTGPHEAAVTRRTQILTLQRQRPHALPSGCEQRVAKRRGDRREWLFADPAPPAATLQDDRLDARHLRHAEHLVVVEIALYHAAILDRDVAVERGAQSEDDCALRLLFNRQRI